MVNLQHSAAAVSPSSSSDPSDLSSLSPAWQAGLLLVARHIAREVALEPGPELSSTPSILQATGAGRSRAYEMRGRVLEILGDLQRPPGRPSAKPPPPPDAELRAELSGHMLRYLYSHPGCISAGPVRQHYSDDLRHFVLELRERYSHVSLADFAEAVHIPADTLADWLRLPSPDELEDASVDASGDASTESPKDPPPPDEDSTLPRIETVLDAWKRWEGTFTDFCHHVHHHLRIPWGRTMISDILFQHRLRTPKRRRGRSPDEKALKDQFETFFAGAQWVGDGSPITVHLAGQPFTFNLELMVDPHSGAFTGFDVRDHEDSQAVLSAFDDGVRTTGSSPLSLLLDNRPSNFTPEVYDTLEPTLLLPATPGRGQNKAHVEGAFGLFAQQAPPLILQADEPRQLAREILTLAFQIWARTLNHKPRVDRNGRSRTQLYREADPGPEQIEQARAALQERLRKQERAAQTRRRRAEPLVRHLLDEAFGRLGLDDPTGNLRDAIANYPLDAVLEAISIFEGKRNALTLPPDADARYLLGIARNLAHEHEGLEIAHALWKNRLRARDLALDHLHTQRRLIVDQTPGHEPLDLVSAFADRALDSSRRIDRIFWLEATADIILTQSPSASESLFRSAAQRITATFQVPYPERLQALRFLAAKILPLHHLHEVA